MSWNISLFGNHGELVDKIDADDFPVSEKNAPDYAKNVFAEVREAVRQIANGCPDGLTMNITGNGHTNGEDNRGTLSWQTVYPVKP